MYLFVLRHGKAEPGSPGGRDADRRLTPDGEESLRRVLRRASAAGLQPDAMLASPYLRARQTAEIAGEMLGLRDAASRCDALVPDSHSGAVWDEVRVLAQALQRGGGPQATQAHGMPANETPQVLLVGHNPLLSDFLMAVMSAGSHAIDLRTAALACVDVGSVRPQPQGRLLWLLSPEICV